MGVLVTGGAGYIGSHCVYDLIEKGEDVIVVDNLHRGHLDAVHRAAKLYIGDIRDREFMDRVFSENDIEAVMHFAANSLVGESMADPLSYYYNNVYGTLILLENMIKNHVKKIVFSSSAAIYGEPRNIPILEDDLAIPTNPYGETKLAVEKMLKWADRAKGIKHISLRYFNVAGAHIEGIIGEDHNPETHLIPLVLQVALNKRDYVIIYGDDYDTPDGTCIRDYIHVIDLSHAHLLALEGLRKGWDSDVFNLGNGEGFSVKEIIESARKVTGHPIPARIGERRPGDTSKIIASSRKAEEILKWKPRFTKIEDIIETAWRWHKYNPEGFRN